MVTYLVPGVKVLPGGRFGLSCGPGPPRYYYRMQSKHASSISVLTSLTSLAMNFECNSELVSTAELGKGLSMMEKLQSLTLIFDQCEGRTAGLQKKNSNR